MSTKLTEVLIFGKVIDVQSLAISGRGEREMIFPERTSPSRTCDLTLVRINRDVPPDVDFRLYRKMKVLRTNSAQSSVFSLTIDLLGRETPCKRHKLVLSLTDFRLYKLTLRP